MAIQAKGKCQLGEHIKQFTLPIHKPLRSLPFRFTRYRSKVVEFFFLNETARVSVNAC